MSAMPLRVLVHRVNRAGGRIARCPAPVAPCRQWRACYLACMTEISPSADPSATDRVDAAIARIEAAIDARTRAADALATRHAALKARMAEAVAALDDVIARESAG